MSNHILPSLDSYNFNVYKLLSTFLMYFTVAAV